MTRNNPAATNDTDHRTTDVLVVGSGIAGLAAALGAAREGDDVTIATKASRPAGASSWWAQGGIAVSRDDPDQFKQDIIDASAGTVDPEMVDVLVENANNTVQDVLHDTLAVDFDTADQTGDISEDSRKSNDYDFCREAAHADARILHVDASTGKHIHVPFLNYLAEHDQVTILEDTAALELITHEDRVHGAMLAFGADARAETDTDTNAHTHTDTNAHTHTDTNAHTDTHTDTAIEPIYAGATILATGGIGDIYPRSTNPDGATGDGIAMAALAGADVADMEYIQFHPTVCVDDPDEPFLLSEAVRGAGAQLRNGDDERFMPDIHPDAELAPRDVVARAVERERERTGDVTLDVTPIDFPEEFPDLTETCEAHGVDWRDGIPVAPAEHFLCGGIAVDESGHTSLDGLYAVGECARTGVHGANRLASTSLLEGLVWGLRAGEDAADRNIAVSEAPDLQDTDPALPTTFAQAKFGRLRSVMADCVGLHRTPEDIERAQAVLRRLKGEVDAYVRTRTSRSLYELRNATITALLITRAAAANDESIGCHHLVEAASSESDGESDDPPLEADGGEQG